MNGTSSPLIQRFLHTILSEEIKFNILLHQLHAPKPNTFTTLEKVFVEEEIKKLFGKGAIFKSTHEPKEFISPIFLRPKPDGSHRMI